MSEDPLKTIEREAAQLHAMAPWMVITPTRAADGRITVHVSLTGGFEADPNDLPGSVIREIHRRLDEFESQLDE
ncbi:MAG TPA: hypothetical protein VHY20_11255 [Pirellulales bacterium]|jgi:hypothetical protein|nr:hypothetical protein [Pirellulales bacterium]